MGWSSLASCVVHSTESSARDVWSALGYGFDCEFGCHWASGKVPVMWKGAKHLRGFLALEGRLEGIQTDIQTTILSRACHS